MLWDQADECIWETRGGPKKFLYSQLMCWVAIERAIRLATRRGLPPRPGALAEGPRCDLPADHGPRLVTNPEGVRPVRRQRRRRRGRSANAAGQVHLT